MITTNRVLSCLQPTGEMHIGNYFGAVANWVKLQSERDCIYGVVDLHAMTMPFEPKVLRANTLNMVLDLLAAGIDPENATLFIQSLVPEHVELAWIFGCICPIGDLYRMTQFKEKSDLVEERGGAFISAGLFTYPVLQAADILVYRADRVPVGKDQEQHLELSREIARRFNYLFGEYLPEPAPLFTESPKVMSLADPEKKMSKSLGDRHYIGLFEDEESVRKKVKTAVTDSNMAKLAVAIVNAAANAAAADAVGKKEEAAMWAAEAALAATSEASPGVANMLELLSACGKDETAASLRKEYDAGTLRYVNLKGEVAEALVELTSGMRRRRKELQKNPEYVRNVIRNGSSDARDIARATLKEVRALTGLPGREW